MGMVFGRKKEKNRDSVFILHHNTQASMEVWKPISTMGLKTINGNWYILISQFRLRIARQNQNCELSMQNSEF